MRSKHLCVLITSKLRERLVLSNMFKPSSIILLTVPVVLLLWIIFVVYASYRFLLCLVCSLQPCDHMLESADPTALLFSCVYSISHILSWVRCAT